MLSEKKIEKFFATTKETGRFNLEDKPLAMLEKLSFIRNNKPTIASMLLFAKNPLRMNIRVGRFKDDITIIDDRQITDTFFEADDMTLEKIKQKNYQSSLRNKLIAEAFYLTANTEKYGTGFIRIEKELENFPNITYEFKPIANAMQITFYKDLKSSVGVNVGVNEVFEYIKAHQPVKTNIIADNFSEVTQRTIERWLKQLKDENKIEFKGSPKTGGYVVK